MLSIKDRLFVDIYINGTQLPLGQLVFNSLTMYSSRVFNFPVAELVVGDNSKYFIDNPIVDGDVIDINTGKDLNSTDTINYYSFRVFSVTVNEDSNKSYVYKFALVLNAPRLVLENTYEAYEGRVSEVFAQIAEQSGLPSIINPTADSQIWYGGGKRRAVFLREITDHAYASNTSGFVYGIDLDGTIKLTDLSRINYDNSVSVFTYQAPSSNNAVRIVGRREFSDSGINNVLAGYKLTTLSQEINNVELLGEVNVSAKSNTFNINNTLNSRLEGGSIYISSIDSGNTHSNYHSAKHQNSRVRSTFSQGLVLSADAETKVGLFDPVKYVDFTGSAGKTEVNSKLSGGYLIDAKTIHITPQAYMEKLLVLRQGFNADLITQRTLDLIGATDNV